MFVCSRWGQQRAEELSVATMASPVSAAQDNTGFMRLGNTQKDTGRE